MSSKIAAKDSNNEGKDVNNQLPHSMGDFRETEHGSLVRRGVAGLSWPAAAFLLLGDMAGGGIVAMPTAVVHSSFILGLVVLLILACVATASSVLLGRAWTILLRRYPVYRTHCRQPYAEIGRRAFGAKMMKVVSACVNITQFGASTVFLLLASRNFADLAHDALGWRIGFCTMVVIVALLLLPVTFLKSPQDFSAVVMVGMISTCAAVVLICVGAWRDRDCAAARDMDAEAERPLRLTTGVFTYLGTVMFSFGGHSAFPTIQHDMRKPSDFGKSSYLAFFIITVINLLVVGFGAWVYGASLGDSVIASIQTAWIRRAINLLIAAHCLMTVTLIINPLNQEIEEIFKIPHGFCLKRILIRGATMVASVFVAETLPSFGSVMDLMGGSTVTLTSMIFPALFFLFLAAADERPNWRQPITVTVPGNSFSTINGVIKADDGADDWPPVTVAEMVRRTPRTTLIFCAVICVIGSIGGIMATRAAVISIFYSDSARFVAPCYAHWFITASATAAALSDDATAATQVIQCCGTYRNVSLLPSAVCAL